MGSGRAAGKQRRVGAVLAVGGFWLLMLLGAVLWGVGLWVRRTFGFVSVDQLLTNLPGGGGAGAGGQGLVIGGVGTGVVVPILAVVVLAVLAEKSRRVLNRRGIPGDRRQRLVCRVAVIVVAVLVPLAGAGYAASTVGAREFIEAYLHEAMRGDDLSDYYVAPELDGAEQGLAATGRDAENQAKNLVLIYLESVEDALADDAVFEKNMLQPVQRATRGWDSIPRLRQYEGGGWTMAGLVSTQCGVPLRTAGAGTDADELNSMGGDGAEDDSYLPGAVCLGDVLADEGYRNVFLGGADADFAGKGAFLATHGYAEVDDLHTWRSLGETEIRADWGLSDRRLFARAEDEVTRLHSAGEPFNLTMLTLDTHEATHVYDYCDWDTESAMTSITSCSMQQVAGFVEFLDQRGYLDDTVVVLMGDHQKMIAQGGNFWDELNARPDRTIFNRVWSPDGAEFARDDIDQLSMYPTLLELVGVQLPDRRAGVGVSAFARKDEVGPGTVLELRSEDYLKLVRSRSTDLYRELWGAAS